MPSNRENNNQGKLLGTLCIASDVYIQNTKYGQQTKPVWVFRIGKWLWPQYHWNLGIQRYDYGEHRLYVPWTITQHSYVSLCCLLSLNITKTHSACLRAFALVLCYPCFKSLLSLLLSLTSFKSLIKRQFLMSPSDSAPIECPYAQCFGLFYLPQHAVSGSFWLHSRCSTNICWMNNGDQDHS